MADIKVSIASPIIEDEEINAVIEVMKSGMIAQGPKVIESLNATNNNTYKKKPKN